MFPAFLDTCVLYSATLRDTVLRIAEERAFRPQWSADVLAELRAALVREAGLEPVRAERVVSQMQRAFPDAEVTDYATLVTAMTCHPKDRHVLAAAVAGGSQVVVTFNARRPADCRESPAAHHGSTPGTPDAGWGACVRRRGPPPRVRLTRPPVRAPHADACGPAPVRAATQHTCARPTHHRDGGWGAVA
ncbi:MAG: PIN domain-containing protein [Propionicimonas sp.]